ncbi:hypothetical protein ACHAWF_017366 [Thalassiosira exigua]
MTEGRPLLGGVPSSGGGTYASVPSVDVDASLRRRRNSTAAAAAAAAEIAKRSDEAAPKPSSSSSSAPSSSSSSSSSFAGAILSQLPAVAIASVLNFMAGIPFGASYFPADFPLEGKEVLGLRMFLFSTFVGQLVYTYTSGFTNGVGLQMVEVRKCERRRSIASETFVCLPTVAHTDLSLSPPPPPPPAARARPSLRRKNVPFFLELARIVLDDSTPDADPVSTVFFLFGTSSVLVGVTFYLLGKFELGRVVYYFPSHVLVSVRMACKSRIVRNLFHCNAKKSALLCPITVSPSEYDNIAMECSAEHSRWAIATLLLRTDNRQAVSATPLRAQVGCIGGIGAFIAITSLEVTTNTNFSWTAEGFNDCIVANLHLLGPVLAFEAVLRILLHVTTVDWEPKYPLLAPVYYCLIMPAFYAFLFAFGVSAERAEAAGYFFPRLEGSGGGGGSVFDASLLEIFTEVNVGSVSWNAVAKSVPCVIMLAAFSLIHVPINIPAFAISTGVEADMNKELGIVSRPNPWFSFCSYSNVLAGMFGGLQNYMSYSNSVVYSKSNGDGKGLSLGICAVTIALFLYGPAVAAYVPRCMAGTLLLHVGIDLFIEGVVESYHDYDKLEYSGVCLITVVMVAFGMDEALIAGVVAALSIYAAQSVVNLDPIWGAMPGARLRSSACNRSVAAQNILLDGRTGRQRIYVVQSQGHVFFGNVTAVTDDVNRRLGEKRDAGDNPAVVIIDFTHVLGLDSSAAQSIAKLKSFILNNFSVEILLFVTGQDGFKASQIVRALHVSTLVCYFSHHVTLLQTTYDLSGELGGSDETSIKVVGHAEHRLSLNARALGFVNNHVNDVETKGDLIAEIPNSRVCETLDDALVFAEDVLIALQDPSILQTDSSDRFPYVHTPSESDNAAKAFLKTLCPGASASDIDALYALFLAEKYRRGDIVWEQGASSDSLKLVVEGTLMSFDDEGGASESITPGSTIGELGLVNGIPHFTTIKVVSDQATLYSLSKEKWESLTMQNPRVARLIDLLVIRYLAHRVQYISAKDILDGRTLPV